MSFGIGENNDLARANSGAERLGCGADESLEVHGVPVAEWAEAMRAIGSYVPRQADGGYLNDDEKAFLEAQSEEADDRPIARVRFECDMLITTEERTDVGADERARKWRPLRCWMK